MTAKQTGREVFEIVDDAEVEEVTFTYKQWEVFADLELLYHDECPAADDLKREGLVEDTDTDKRIK